MSINWNEFERPTGDYPDRFKFENEGDTVSGKITQIRVATMPDGSRYPSITIDTGERTVEVLASQTQLLRLLASTQPKTGDQITITHTNVEKLAGGKTLKHFTIDTAPSAAPSGPLV